MIANPLVWNSDLQSECGRYSVTENSCLPNQVFFIARYRVGDGEPLGACYTAAEAQAACERHHQVGYVRGLTITARVALRDYAVWSRNRPAFEEAAKWLSILDEAEQP